MTDNAEPEEDEPSQIEVFGRGFGVPGAVGNALGQGPHGSMEVAPAGCVAMAGQDLRLQRIVENLAPTCPK